MPLGAVLPLHQNGNDSRIEDRRIVHAQSDLEVATEDAGQVAGKNAHPDAEVSQDGQPSTLRLAAKKLGLGLLAIVTRPPWWRMLRGFTLVSHRASPARLMVPAKLRGKLQHAWKPVIVIQLSKWLLRQYMPIVCRTAALWQGVLRVYSGYMWTKHQCETNLHWTNEERASTWSRRHDWGGDEVHRLVLQLSGYYVKAAQILASKEEFMPQQWTQRLAALYDAMPPQPWRSVSGSIRQELQFCPLAHEAGGKLKLASVFSSIESEPAAAASIAQVHFAELTCEVVGQLHGNYVATAMQVAVKVQHAGVERLMTSDLLNLGLLARFLKHVLPFNPLPVVDEIRESIPREFNFLLEMRMMNAIREGLEATGVRGINIPRAIAPLCSSRLLVLERMQGMRFTALLQQVRQQPGLSAVAQEAVSKLLKAYGYMILRLGLFHADPHPGNLLLQAHSELALLDFGQVGVLSAESVRAFARLVLAMHHGDPHLVALSIAGLGLGFAPRAGGTNPCVEHVACMAYVMFDTRCMDEASLNPFDLSHHPMLRETSITCLAPHWWMLIRTFMLLRGLTHTLDMDVSTASLWHDMAHACLLDPSLDTPCTAYKSLDGAGSCPEGQEAGQWAQEPDQ